VKTRHNLDASEEKNSSYPCGKSKDDTSDALSIV